MEFAWILFAFLCGIGVKLISLPPLIGYLCAGFLLNFLGFQPTESLTELADLGITLMLFTIGLKLNPWSLTKPEVWAGTLAPMVLWLLVSLPLLLGGAALSLSLYVGVDQQSAALLAFAGSFSSTVCVVKLLEESGEIRTRHGRLAISILVMQDVVAVAFLVLATGKTPSIYAPLLLLLIPFRPAFNWIMQRAGHGELLPLTGLFLALGSYQLFDLVHIKGDLGALIAGMMLSHFPKASELNKSLMSFKDLFLIGFFLSIGFTELPDMEMLASALLLSVLLPVKFLLCFAVLAALRLKVRTAFLTSLALSNFSEFGLIVADISSESGWLDPHWLVVLAVAISISFVFTNILYRRAHGIYRRINSYLRRFERHRRLPEDEVIQPQNAEILVIGMGRVGRGAFEALYTVLGDNVWGMDSDRQRVEVQQQRGVHVFLGDGEDADFWDNLDTSSIKMILLSLPSIEDMLNTTKQARAANYQGMIAAIARYEDDRNHLLNMGIDKVFNFFTEAGTGFAEEALTLIGKEKVVKEEPEEPAIAHS